MGAREDYESTHPRPDVGPMPPVEALKALREWEVGFLTQLDLVENAVPSLQGSTGMLVEREYAMSNIAKLDAILEERKPPQ